jgi:DNA-binding NtrC family response regulator
MRKHAPLEEVFFALRVGTVHAYLLHVEWTSSILVVDDDLATREMVVALLREERIRARSVGSVDEAVEALGQETFDAILSDVRMPEKDGFTLLREMRDRGHRIPVILMTSFATSETARDARAAGAFDCLLKPFARSALTEMVRRAFKAKATVDDPATCA